MFILFLLCLYLILINSYCTNRFSPLPISALSGTGTGELLDLVCSGLEKIEVIRLYDLPLLTILFHFLLSFSIPFVKLLLFF